MGQETEEAGVYRERFALCARSSPPFAPLPLHSSPVFESGFVWSSLSQFPPFAYRSRKVAMDPSSEADPHHPLQGGWVHREGSKVQYMRYCNKEKRTHTHTHLLFRSYTFRTCACHPPLASCPPFSPFLPFLPFATVAPRPKSRNRDSSVIYVLLTESQPSLICGSPAVGPARPLPFVVYTW